MSQSRAFERSGIVLWDEDALEFGYVLDRPSTGGWWHLHFGRADWVYHCKLLGRDIDILACIRRFGAGAVAQSASFLLTLDGEGVELSAEQTGLNFRWGEDSEGMELATEARSFQREVVPLLFDSSVFQQAAAEIVSAQRYLRVVEAGKLRRTESGTPGVRRGD
jgi:hypothetical protein